MNVADTRPCLAVHDCDGDVPDSDDGSWCATPLRLRLCGVSLLGQTCRSSQRGKHENADQIRLSRLTTGSSHPTPLGRLHVQRLSEIYVIPFPPSPTGGRWLVSKGGGVMPRWRRDGKELFYISPGSQMMVVDVTTQPGFTSGNPQPLFQTDMVDTGIRTGPMSWDIAPDGRFLIVSDASTDTSITVVLNWRAAESN
jgi:hypothetical protein